MQVCTRVIATVECGARSHPSSGALQNRIRDGMADGTTIVKSQNVLLGMVIQDNDAQHIGRLAGNDRIHKTHESIRPQAAPEDMMPHRGSR